MPLWLFTKSAEYRNTYALNRLIRLARRGDAKAKFKVAFLMKRGIVLPNRPKKIFKLLLQAAELGNTDAFNWLIKSVEPVTADVSSILQESPVLGKTIPSFFKNSLEWQTADVPRETLAIFF